MLRSLVGSEMCIRDSSYFIGIQVEGRVLLALHIARSSRFEYIHRTECSCKKTSLSCSLVLRVRLHRPLCPLRERTQDRMFMQESTIVILTGASCSFTSPALPASSTYRRQNAHARKHHYNTHWCFEFVFAVRQHPHAPFGHKVKQSSKLRRQWHVGTCLLYTSPSPRDS